MRKGQLVKIKWMDITTNLSTPDIDEPLVTYAVGRVICSNKKMEGHKTRFVVLTSGWYENQKDWPERDTITIPKGCIETVEVLEVKK